MEPRVVGTVVLVEGVVLARSADGKQRQLKHGDRVFEGEVIEVVADGHVQLAFEQGGRLLLRSRETITLDSAFFDNVFGMLPDETEGGRLLGRVREGTTEAGLSSRGRTQPANPD